MEGKSKLSAQWWWFDMSNTTTTPTPRKSPWLHSTLSELDDKTEAMLNLIEEDADSFAKRAEMYYKKRPELISIVQDLYRAHRSLAERYDQLKFDSGSRHLTPWTSCPLPLSKLIKESDKSYDSYSESFDFDQDFDSDHEIYDEHQQQQDYPCFGEEIEEEKSSSDDEEGINKLREEIERLREENKVQLLQKDEEKREAIRQFSFSVCSSKKM